MSLSVLSLADGGLAQLGWLGSTSPSYSFLAPVGWPEHVLLMDTLEAQETSQNTCHYFCWPKLGVWSHLKSKGGEMHYSHLVEGTTKPHGREQGDRVR